MSMATGAGWWRPESAPTSRVPAGAFPDGAESQGDNPIPFRALLAFTFVLLVAPQSFVPGLGSLRIGMLTAAAAITAYLFDCVARRRPVVRMSRELWITSILLLWAVLTLPFSYWPGGSLSLLLEGYFKTLAIFWLLPNVVTTLPRLRRIAWALSLMSAPLAAYGIKQFLAGRFIDDGSVKRIAAYEAPLTQNPNDLALMLNLILPLAIALFLTGRPKTRALLLGLIALDAAAVILTFSRAGFLTLATTIALYVARLLGRPRGRGIAIAAVVLVLIAVPFLPGGYMERLSTITDIKTDPTGSAQERWADTIAALRFILHHPVVGAGVGMNILALNEVRGPEWKQVHNVYLEYAVDLGIPGLVLFVMLLLGCLRAAAGARRTAGAAGSGEPALLAEGLQASLIAFAVAAVFHPVAYHFYFYYIAGLALAARGVIARGAVIGWPPPAGLGEAAA